MEYEKCELIPDSVPNEPVKDCFKLKSRKAFVSLKSYRDLASLARARQPLNPGFGPRLIFKEFQALRPAGLALPVRREACLDGRLRALVEVGVGFVDLDGFAGDRCEGAAGLADGTECVFLGVHES
jgi:hypothetical protein